MKKIILAGIIFMMFMGIANASSINGDFKGNPVVKLLLDGKEVTADDVPAIIYDNRTMIPVYLLKKMGISVTWDLDSFSADIKLPENNYNAPTGISLSDLENKLKSQGVDLITRTSDSNNVDDLMYYTNYTYDVAVSKINEFNSILDSAILTDATTLRIFYFDARILSVPINEVRDFKNNKITSAQLQTFFTFNSIPISSNESPSTIQTPTPKPASAITKDISVCNSINSNYANQESQTRESYSARGLGDSGVLISAINSLESQKNSELSAHGCS